MLSGVKRLRLRAPRQRLGKNNGAYLALRKPMFDSPLLAYAVLLVSLASLIYALRG